MADVNDVLAANSAAVIDLWYGVGRRLREVSGAAHSSPLQTDARRNLKTARPQKGEPANRAFAAVCCLILLRGYERAPNVTPLA